MNCTYLPNLESSLNSREHLKEEGIIQDSNRILSSLDHFDFVVNKLNQSARLNYQVTEPLYTREKRGEDWYAQGNPKAFEAIDQKRKDLGIYTSKESVGSFNQRQIDELYKEPEEVFAQKDNIVSSKASSETISKVKEMLSRMGVNIEELDTSIYKDTNGLANLSKQVVQIAQGKEDIALTEEGMHFVTAIVKQTNPVLYKQMLNKIGNYQIFSQVMNSDYAKQYMKDGKPDIIKLKEEAIGKVLAEHVILKEEGSTENPDNILQVESWWGKIKDFLRSLFQKAAINPFEEVAKQALEGNIGTAEDIQDKGEFKQLNPFAEDLEGKLQAKIAQYNLTKHEDKLDPDDENNSSYYTVTKDGKEIKTERTTEYAKKQNLKNTGGKDNFLDTPKDKLLYWGKKAMAGTNGHYDIENIIKGALGEDGYLKSKEQRQVNITPTLNKGVFNTLQKFLLGTTTKEGFLDKFPEGTKFLTEQRVYNEKTNRAGTIDLLAIYPDGKVEVYDWKFMGFSLNKNTDIPKNKRSQHALQLGDYKTTLKTYGVKDVDAFTIPIHAEYEDAEVNGVKSPILQSVTIGKTNIKDENRTYLLPVVPEDQSTGIPEVDKLVQSLKVQYQKIFKKKVSLEDKDTRDFDANQISIAIRNLQVRLNFDALSTETKSFKTLVENTLTKYKDTTDPSILKELNSLQSSALVYEGIDSAFIATYGTDNLSEKDAATLSNLQQFSSIAKELNKNIIKKIESIVEPISQKEIKRSILTPELEIKGILSNFTVPSFVGNNTINLFTKILNAARGNQKRVESTKIHEFLDLYYKAGPNVYEKLAKKDKVELVDKTSKEFRDNFKKAQEDQNKKFFKDNLNLEEYNKAKDEYITRKDEYITAQENLGRFDSNPKINKAIATKYRLDARNSVNLTSLDFNGFQNQDFTRLFWKYYKEGDNSLSKEYKAIKSDPKVFAVYDWLVNFNKDLKAIGYLPQSASLSFIGLMTGSDLERLSQGGSLKNIIQDKFIVQLNEEQQFSSIDPETNEVRKSIPTYFTRTDKEYKELSKDLPKIMAHLIEATEKFRTNSNLEDMYHSMLLIEQNKNHLELDKTTGKIITDNNGPKQFAGNKVNSDLLESIGNDAIYSLEEDNNTFVDLAANKLFKGTDEEKSKKVLGVKKIFNATNSYVQVTAVGAKVLITLPNLVGAGFQAMINSGSFYKGLEYAKNYASLVSSLNGDVKKGAIDLFVPLEHVGQHARRTEGFKNNKLDYIKSWSFKDIMMAGNSLADISHELANAGTWVDNTIVVDGKFQNIRQYLRNLPEYANRYEEDNAILKQKEKDFEAKVRELQEKAISKIGQFVDGHFTVPGVDLENSNFGEYRSKIVNYGRKITAQMSADDKAEYRKSIILRSFAQFKNWIIPQIQLRAGGMKRNDLLDEWEYGRVRLYFKVAAELGVKSIFKIRAIRMATPEGIQIMKKLLEDKKEAYLKSTGQVLEISDNEFFDMVRKELTSETKELRMLMGILLVGLAVWTNPPKKKDNKYKTMSNALSKVSDELRFYYNPLSFQSMTKGSILPSISILAKAEKIITSLGSAGFDKFENNQTDEKRDHPTKYIMDVIPGLGQFNKEILPIWSPDAAKELGIVTPEVSRQQ